MSGQDNNAQWDSLWQEYSKSLENWKTLFEQMQKASAEMQSKFNEVWEKATAESSNDTLKSFGENWQRAMTETNMRAFEGWQKGLGDTGKSSFAQFADSWQKSLGTSGLDQMNAYGEMMMKFADTWNSMWPQPG